MLSLLEYLTEAASGLEYGLDNDSKGKIHEVLSAAFLKTGGTRLLDNPDHLAHGTVKKLKFPEHFRSEKEDKEGNRRKEGEAPEELYERLRTSGGPGGRALTNVELQHHWEKARAAATNIMRQEASERAAKGLKPRNIKHVHWTSNPTDIQTLTGINGAKNTSDIAITWDDDEVAGKSMKVGKKSSPPTLANPGKEQLHALVNSDLSKDHKDREPDKDSTWDNETEAYRKKSMERIFKRHGQKHGLMYNKDERSLYQKGPKLSKNAIADLEKRLSKKISENIKNKNAADRANGNHAKANKRLADLFGEQHGFLYDKDTGHLHSKNKLSIDAIRDIEESYPDTQEENRADAGSGCERIAERLHKHFLRHQKKDPMLLAHGLRALAQSDVDASGMRVDRVQTSGEVGNFKSKIVNPHEEMEELIRTHGPHMSITRTGNTLYWKGKKDLKTGEPITLATLQIKPKSSGGFTAPIGVLNGIKGKGKTIEAGD